MREHVLVKAKKLYPARARADPPALPAHHSAASSSSARAPQGRLDRSRQGARAVRGRSADKWTRELTARARRARRRTQVHPRRERAHRAAAGRLRRPALTDHRAATCDDHRGHRRDRCSTPEEASSWPITAGQPHRGRARARSSSTCVHTFQFLAQIPWTRELRRHPGDRPLAPREARRHRLPVRLPRRPDPGAVAHDGDRRHLRRAHRHATARTRRRCRSKRRSTSSREEQARRRARRRAARSLHRRARLRPYRLALAHRSRRGVARARHERWQRSRVMHARIGRAAITGATRRW